MKQEGLIIAETSSRKKGLRIQVSSAARANAVPMLTAPVGSFRCAVETHRFSTGAAAFLHMQDGIPDATRSASKVETAP